jgi:hypothetical protein
MAVREEHARQYDDSELIRAWPILRRHKYPHKASTLLLVILLLASWSTGAYLASPYENIDGAVMEIVKLVHITLNRIGTASGSRSAFSESQQRTLHAEAKDSDLQTIRDLVIRVAEEHGEAAGALDNLASGRQSGAKTVTFDIQGPSTFYSQPYATCEVFAALKSAGRYFRLDEVRIEHSSLTRKRR